MAFLRRDPSLESAFRAGPTQERESIVSKITTIDTPLGALGLASNGEALTAISFNEEIEDLRGLQVAVSEDPILAETEAQLLAYFQGEFKSFDLPLSMSGTAFQRRVWEARRLRIARSPRRSGWCLATRVEQSGLPMGPIRSRSSCPAIGSLEPTEVSPATAVGSSASNTC